MYDAWLLSNNTPRKMFPTKGLYMHVFRMGNAKVMYIQRKKIFKSVRNQHQ